MKFFIPLGLFAILVVFLIFGLSNSDHVKDIPSPLINRHAPDFTLNTLRNEQATFSPKMYLGQVWVLNVWASWCASCRAEHEVIKRMIQQYPIDLVGLNYKDSRQDAQLWLSQWGNPYTLIAVDDKGNAGIDWGVYGVPETFVIDKKGNIRKKYTGPLTDEMVKSQLLPLLTQLKME